MISEQPFLSLIVPVYNEEKRLEPPLSQVFNYLQRAFPRHEVLYVNDGSTDTTYSKILEIQKSYPSLRIVHNVKHSGKGHAVRCGLEAAQGDVLLFSDADFSAPIKEATKLLPFLVEGYDIVIGSRGLADSNIEVHQAWARETMGKTFNWIIRTLLPLDIHDTQCGFKMMRRTAAELLLPRMRINGFAFDVEMLMIAQLHRLKIAEVPVTWRNVPESKVHPIRNSMEMLFDVLNIRYRLAMNEYT